MSTLRLCVHAVLMDYLTFTVFKFFSEIYSDRKKAERIKKFLAANNFCIPH